MNSEFGSEADAFAPWPHNQTLYLFAQLRPGCTDAHFGRNQLSPRSLGFSPLIPDHPRDWHLTTGIGPPCCFRSTSTCPGLDHAASDLVPVISSPFRLCSSLLRVVSWLLSLWILDCYQLSSPLKQTPCSVFRNGCHDSVTLFSYSSLARLSFEKISFKPWLTIAKLDSGSISPPFRDTFQLYFKILVCYRLCLCLEFDVNDTKISATH